MAFGQLTQSGLQAPEWEPAPRPSGPNGAVALQDGTHCTSPKSQRNLSGALVGLSAAAPLFDEVLHMKLFDMAKLITSPGAGHLSAILGNTPALALTVNSSLTSLKRPARKMADSFPKGLDLVADRPKLQRPGRR